MCERYLDVERCLTVGPTIRTGMPILTESPHELGADRIVNAVAAYDRFGGACVVVDFGTAITYDAVSEAGEYLGGAIAPGIEISIEALASRAAKLPKIDLVPAGGGDRPQHPAVDPVGDRLRLRGAGRRHRPPNGRRARRAGHR